MTDTTDTHTSQIALDDWLVQRLTKRPRTVQDLVQFSRDMKKSMKPAELHAASDEVRKGLIQKALQALRRNGVVKCVGRKWSKVSEGK